MSEALQERNEAGGKLDKLVETVMARHHYSGDALIEVLHAAQQSYGSLSIPLLKVISRKLRLPPSRVFGVATFYHLFHLTPNPAHAATVCLGTACYVEGAAALADQVKQSGWALETVRCSGCCGLAPLVVCDGAALTRVTRAQLADRLQHDSGIPPRSSAN